MKKSVKIIFFMLIFLIPSSKVRSDQFYDVVIDMCRPTVPQIKNIEWLYEKDLITYRRIKLLCVYHEEEKTDYKPSFTYVKKKKLSWVDFVCMKGMVRMENLFRKNSWTKDFLKIFKNSNGIIFTGGMDIPPSI